MLKVAFFCPGYESLGIEWLSASLRAKGFQTKLFFDPILFSESNFFDQAFLGRLFSFRSKILEDLKSYSPDIVCFSVISDNYQWACQWAGDIKAAVAARIIFGGIHPTSVPERVMDGAPVDYICIGEGDEALVELATALASGGDDTGILNIWKKGNGVVFRNPVRPLMADLDRLPFPDKALFAEAHPVFQDGYLTMTARGCAYACTYCCNNVYHRLYKNEKGYFRRRSVPHVIAELQEAKQRTAPRYIAFADDSFNDQEDWLFHFLREYKLKIGLPFSCYVFPDLVNDSQVRAFKEAGCFKVQMGLQVISPEKRRRVLGRVSSQENVARAIDLFRRERIFVVCDAIIGFPQETEDDLVALAQFYCNHTPDHCESFWLRYYPGTDMTRWARNQGHIDEERLKAIESGQPGFGLLKKAEHPVSKTYARQIVMLLMLYPFLPRNMKKWWLEKRRYRKLPVVPSLMMYVLVRLMNHPPFDINTERTWKRYRYFLTCWVKRMFRL